MLCRECHEDAHRCESCNQIQLKAKHIKSQTKICDQCKQNNSR